MPPAVGTPALLRMSRPLVCGRLRVLAAAFAMMTCNVLGATQPQVILNASVAPPALDRNALRSLFTLRTREWSNGMPVRVFVLDDADPRHAAFCSEVLGTFPYILRRTWDRNLFSGTGLAPERVRDLNEMREKVRSTPGGVGYVFGGKNDIPKTPDGGDIHVHTISPN